MLFIHIQLIQKSSHSFTNEWKNHEILSGKSLRTQDLDLIGVSTNLPNGQSEPMASAHGQSEQSVYRTHQS